MPDKLHLSLAISPNDRVQPLLDGTASIEGVDLLVTRAHPSEIFWRQLRFREFDISEMSMSSLLITVSQGASDWVALPIFPSRRVFHAGILVSERSRISVPGDLRGKRVGVPEYQLTAVVWTRGVLQHRFGVAPAEVEWLVERSEELSHGAATGFTPPGGISVHRIPGDTSIAGMLVEGGLDAALVYFGQRTLVDRSPAGLEKLPGIRRLFDPIGEASRYYQETGIYPANHCVVIRRSLVERYPWLPGNIFAGFVEAKRAADARRLAALAPYRELGHVAEAVVEKDLFPYGLTPNRVMLDTLIDYELEHGLISSRPPLDRVFAASTGDLVG